MTLVLGAQTRLTLGFIALVFALVIGIFSVIDVGSIYVSFRQQFFNSLDGSLETGMRFGSF